MAHRHSSALLLLLLVTAFATSEAVAATRAALCRAACEARNVPASCTWMAARRRRCVHHAVAACVKQARQGLPVMCPSPVDLPGCLTNHSCPFGSLCVDATCQVVPCAPGPDGIATCTGMNTCQGTQCVVADCAGSSENCPAGLHCQPADGILGSISGTCQPDDPSITYCTSSTDCITSGIFDPVCVHGQCAAKRRRGGSSNPTTTTTLPGGGTRCSCRCDDDSVCTTHADCGVDSLGIPNVCGCPLTAPCDGHGGVR